MNGVTKADMQSAIQHLRDDLQRAMLSRQEMAILLTGVANQLMAQMRDQQNATKQMSAQLVQLSQHLPAIEQTINNCKQDLRQITSR